MREQGRILVVDDEVAIRLFLAEELTQEGYKVLTAASGEEALARLQTIQVDVILLDLLMEGIDGLQVMDEVERYSSPPVVIMLTAHASLDSAITAMRRGGHDYLIKPCRTEELLASVEKGLAKRREVLRRQALARLIEDSARRLRSDSLPERIEPVAQVRFLEARGLLLDRENSTITRQGKSLSLTPTEFRLLHCLMKHADKPVSFGQLAGELHSYSVEEQGARNALSTHLWRLRRKVGSGPDGKPYIVNVRGRGYKFVSGKE